jgi:hypothetical protein
MNSCLKEDNVYNLISRKGDFQMYNKRSPLTFEQYSEQMSYDSATGVFTWIKPQSRRYKAGMEIGNIKSRRDKYGVLRQYRYIGLYGQQVPAARVAWLLHYGKWPAPDQNILFKDGDTLNCRIENLKESEFPPIKSIKEGKRAYTNQREQNRRFGLKRYYGMTMETYNVMLAAQNGVCDICKGAETYQPKTYSGPKALSVDHNHETGAIRGLLCSNCNYLIGHCKEDREVLIEAIKYLDKHAGRTVAAPTLTVVPTEESH